MLDTERIAALREKYPEGSRVRLQELNDPYTKMEPCSEGTLKFIDDVGTCFVDWDNGSSLGLIIGVDSFSVFPPDGQKQEMKMV